MTEKEKKRVPLKPASAYAPLRGQNQDQGGIGVTHDHADYTISDEHIHDMDQVAHQPEWEKETPSTRKKIAKKLMKDTERGVYFKESDVVSGVAYDTKGSLKAQIRGAGKPGTLNSPASAASLQRAADATSRAKEQDARDRSEDQEQDREDEIRRRKMNRKSTLIGEALERIQARKARMMQLDEKIESVTDVTPKDDDDHDHEPKLDTAHESNPKESGDWDPSHGSPSAEQYGKMSSSDQFGARYMYDRDHGLLPKGGAAVGDDEVDDMHKREYDAKKAAGMDHLINPKNPYLTPGYTGPKDSFGKSKADWDKEAAERRDVIAKHGMDEFNRRYGYAPGSPRFSKVDDQSAELERKVATHNMLKANGMKSPYEDTPAVKESTLATIKKVVAETRELKGNQKKLDANHNGKLDKQDFEILRGKKKMNEGKCPKCGMDPCKCSHVKEEVQHIDEARGRPRKDSMASDSADEHPIAQARKVISTRGMTPFTFANGKKHMMNPMTAHRVLAHHDNLHTPSEKEAFASRIHKSPESLQNWMAGKPDDEPLPKISLGGSSKIGGMGARKRPTV